MCKLKMLCLVCMSALCTLLCACSQASQVEDQAYVLVMGLDRTPEGKIQMTVQIPRISGSGNTESGSEKGNYKHFSIKADSYEAALEKLSWAATREPDLAQMKLIVLSRKLAEEETAKELIENIAQTERLYTATKLAVCEGEAKAFVEAIQPNIGTRISTDLDSLFEHYSAQGYLPDSTLADLYYYTESIYSDPMTAYAILAESQKTASDSSQKGAAAAAMSGAVKESAGALESDNPTQYLGAAIFVDGQMRGIFNSKQTQIANLLRNQLKSMLYEFEGQRLIIVPTRSVRLKVKTNCQPAEITVDAKLSIAAQEKKPNEDKLRIQLERDILETIEAARSMYAEPFGFAEKAAVHFPTFDAWQEYNWRRRFQTAKVHIKLRFAYSDT